MEELEHVRGDSGLGVIDGFLSGEECARIVDELELAYWQQSLTYRKQEDGRYRNEYAPQFRTSETAHEEWYSKSLKSILKGIEARLGKLFRFDTSLLEPWQALNYARNGKLDYHLDSGYWDDHWAGDRVLTFLLYLNTPRQGGGTHFRALDRSIAAKTGRLLVWNNLFANGDCNGRMIHSGAPVLKGKKITLVTWQRQKRFRIR